MNETYWGSVRFFRHLYTTVFVVILFLPVLAVIWFWQVSIAAPRSTVQIEKDRKFQVAMERTATDAFPYQKKYPGLFAGLPAKRTVAANTVYLTFDDGPSPLTEKILDVLKHYRIKATFFVVGRCLESAAGQETARRILREGHSIGMHSDTHHYRKIYASVDNWLDDFAAVEKKLADITGVRPTIFRFPGGSINVYNAHLYQELIAEMTRRGYVYFDWNISNGDALGLSARAETLVANVVSRQPDNSRTVVLMHDSAGKTETLKALPRIIEHYRTQGLSFGRLSNDVWPVTFGYRS
ncbi:polysaccharide deacetylase [Oxalobacter aliiformigenes]|uniref:polysaccharide deacetylase family protein n=1 Tax=Oxalobacter aliiformigenes TaxID=2946593 RepID=UPI0022AE71A6|nr:polysaccharide deacetylase family protein [Oxalobacter aliiformigenes]WAV88445.1 polysaccharide deacetylase [Oxalobacter aliiformigenes]